MKQRIAILAVMLALIGGYLWWQGRPADGSILYGNVDIREVQLAFRQPGRVTQMAFDEGDSVTAGARLATLDAQPYQDALAAAQAQVQVAQAELGKLRRGLRPQIGAMAVMLIVFSFVIAGIGLYLRSRRH